MNTLSSNLRYSTSNSVTLSKFELAAKEIEENKASHINLTSEHIDDDQFQTLTEALDGNTSLKTLNLTDNNIFYQGAQTLTKALFRNTTLTILDLSLNEIGIKGAQSFAELLFNNTSLKILITLNFIFL